VGGLVPANQGLVMSITSNVYNCPTPVFTQNIGPFATDTTLHVTVTIPVSNQVTVSGTVEGCNNQPLANGTVIVFSGQYGMYYSTVTNGTYSVTYPTCNSTGNVSVTVIDSANNVVVSSANIPVTGSAVTVPLITACTTSTQSVYNITQCQVSGTYYAGVSVTPNNTIFCAVEVITAGAYTIATPVINGVSFSGSGIFTTPGVHTAILQANGTPVVTGTFSFNILGSTGQGCTSVLTVGNQPPPPAAFTLDCSNPVLGGSFNAGLPFTGNNTITLTANVTSAGSYYINTNAVNGYYFQDSGFFNTTGVQTIVLIGYGTPQGAGTFQMTVQYNGISNCIFPLTINPSSSAVYTFNGAPGTCQFTATGTYSSGIPLSPNNTVAVVVNVTTMGAYTITTNTAGGMSFNTSGVFNTTGVQTIFLTGSGTPTAQGIYTFVPQGNMTTPTCNFSIQVN
jgi:hypothetical protein